MTNADCLNFYQNIEVQTTINLSTREAVYEAKKAKKAKRTQHMRAQLGIEPG